MTTLTRRALLCGLMSTATVPVAAVVAKALAPARPVALDPVPLRRYVGGPVYRTTLNGRPIQPGVLKADTTYLVRLVRDDDGEWAWDFVPEDRLPRLPA